MGGDCSRILIMQKTKKKIVNILFIMAVIIILAGGFYLAEKSILPHERINVEDPVTVRVQSGSSLTEIAKLLDEKGVIRNVNDFILTVKIFRAANRLKAGQYEFQPGLSNYKVMKKLMEGSISDEKIVIPEGYTSKQIASLLQKRLEIDSTEFVSLIKDKNLLQETGVESNSFEGYLYPDTYHLNWGISARSVIKRLVKEFHRNFTDSLKSAARQKGWDVHQIVTLASIIEGEAILDEERRTISSVYHNRLVKGMLLQADPTIQFIIPDGPRRLLNRDLRLDSPYNTYMYAGLPPGPVNNPGIKSMIAAIDPADTPYLYFVARGDGGHTFSRTLNQHLRAKRDFDRHRREVYGKKRK